jgi:hypothetical protein
MSERLLQKLLAEMRALRADVQALTRRRETVNAGRLIAAIGRCAEEHDFNTGELFNHSRFDGPVKDMIAGMTPKQVGRVLRSVVGKEFDGFTLERLHADANGVIWRVWGPCPPEP